MDTVNEDSTIQWRKSSRSNSTGGACVEVGLRAGTKGSPVYIRDSKQHGSGPVLSVPTADWRDFLDSLTHPS